MAEDELRLTVLQGDQFERAAGQFFRDAPGEVIPSQAEQLFPFSRLMLG